MKKMTEIRLRETNAKDFDTLFSFHLDKEANFLAGFTSKNPADKNAFISKWTRLLLDEKINLRTITLEDKVVGSIAKFEMNGNSEVTYWIGKKYWGKGIATNALKRFLQIEKSRPIFGRVAFDNIGSQKVLKKCGFVQVGTQKGFANARNIEIEEIIFQLN